MGVTKMLECFSMSSSGCFCTNSIDEEEIEKFPLMEIDNNRGQNKRYVDVAAEKQTLAFQLKPKVHRYAPLILLCYISIESENGMERNHGVG